MAGSSTQRSVTVKIYQLLPVTDLSGGVVLRTAQTLLKPERSLSLVNWSLGQPGALVVRAGYQAFSTTSMGSGRPQGGQRVYLNTAIHSQAFFFSSRRRHTRSLRDWSSDVCSSD